MTHQYMPKLFHNPRKNLPDPRPAYLMYGALEKYIYIATAKMWEKQLNKR